MSAPTHDDANLLLRLYEMRRDEKMRQAREFFNRSFHASSVQEMMTKYPPASQEGVYIRMVVSYWDMVASFVNAGLLHRELFFQNTREMLLVWEKIRDLAPGMREMMKDPSQVRNLEAVATAYIAWMQQQGPETYPAFSTRVAGMRP